MIETIIPDGTLARLFDELLVITVRTDGSYNGEIFYQLAMPAELSELGLCSLGGRNVEEINLSGLLEDDDVCVFGQRSSRRIIFQLPHEDSPAGVYEPLADRIREYLDKPELGVRFEHVCRHCGHDATDTF